MASSMASRRAFYNAVTALVNRRRVTNISCLDFCRAFDTVPHHILVSVLDRHGFDGWNTLWTRKWLDGHTQLVVVNGLTSKWRLVTSGDPPELALGPALFNTLVRDMQSGIICNLCRPAKNISLCGGVHTVVGRDGIQKDFDGPEGWIHVNLIKFYKAKSKVLHVH